jgi:hypothetical protein
MRRHHKMHDDTAKIFGVYLAMVHIHAVIGVILRLFKI